MMATVNMNIAATFIDTLTVSRAAAVNIFSVIKRKSTIDSSSSDGLKPKDFQGVIEFKNVSFRYPARPLVKVRYDLTIFFLLKNRVHIFFIKFIITGTQQIEFYSEQRRNRCNSWKLWLWKIYMYSTCSKILRSRRRTGISFIIRE